MRKSKFITGSYILKIEAENKNIRGESMFSAVTYHDLKNKRDLEKRLQAMVDCTESMGLLVKYSEWQLIEDK